MTSYTYHRAPNGRIYQLDGRAPSDDWIKLPFVKGREAYRLQCIDDLDGLILPAGRGYGIAGKIYTCIRHVSRSSMSCIIGLYVVEDGEIVDISHIAAGAIGWKSSKSGVYVAGKLPECRDLLIETVMRSIGASSDDVIVKEI